MSVVNLGQIGPIPRESKASNVMMRNVLKRKKQLQQLLNDEKNEINKNSH